MHIYMYLLAFLYLLIFSTCTDSCLFRCLYLYCILCNSITCSNNLVLYLKGVFSCHAQIWQGPELQGGRLGRWWCHPRRLLPTCVIITFSALQGQYPHLLASLSLWLTVYSVCNWFTHYTRVYTCTLIHSTLLMVTCMRHLSLEETDSTNHQKDYGETLTRLRTTVIPRYIETFEQENVHMHGSKCICTYVYLYMYM